MTEQQDEESSGSWRLYESAGSALNGTPLELHMRNIWILSCLNYSDLGFPNTVAPLTKYTEGEEPSCAKYVSCQDPKSNIIETIGKKERKLPENKQCTLQITQNPRWEALALSVSNRLQCGNLLVLMWELYVPNRPPLIGLASPWIMAHWIVFCKLLCMCVYMCVCLSIAHVIFKTLNEILIYANVKIKDLYNNFSV